MILYVLLSKETFVFSEYTELEDEFEEMARIILKSVNLNLINMSFTLHTYFSNLKFFCIIHNDYIKEKPFVFLGAILQEYQNQSKNSNINNDQFSVQFSCMMKDFNKLNQKRCFEQSQIIY
ncbi:unnamed protein product [Paramecium sonneborni]|uniref:Uncharacterized protein n=1 Tax=Paramecium sonneborni TaxID=65129 RepID=A0A8S1PRM2_9CILI|nr:unnamed protein product [Paramecium sonneborni]